MQVFTRFLTQSGGVLPQGFHFLQPRSDAVPSRNALGRHTTSTSQKAIAGTASVKFRLSQINVFFSCLFCRQALLTLATQRDPSITGDGLERRGLP
jgi:hypothetical protein